MVRSRAVKQMLQKGFCCVFLLCVSVFCLTGCQTAEQAVKNSADGVVKADQWFRDKFW
ncbi:MAG: hypothetical protein ABIC68_04555 [Candidatus Omnitrophota bacterium]